MVIIYGVVLCFWDFSNPSREKNKSRIIERDDISSLEHAYLCSLRLLGPDDVLRKGSGTLCESLLMNQARWGPQCCGNGVSWSRMVLYITVYRYCNTYHIHSYTCMITMVYIYIHTIYNYTYIWFCVCIYIYANPPWNLQYRFRLFIVFYSDFCWLLPSKATSILFIHLKTLDAWIWWVMMLHV